MKIPRLILIPPDTFDFLGLVAACAIFDYCDGNQNRNRATGSEPHGQLNSAQYPASPCRIMLQSRQGHGPLNDTYIG